MESFLLQAYHGQKTSRPPIWLMRQAGRFLPEYREIRAQHSMLDCIRSPELAAKITLQPIERFGFDAAIIFADILNPLIGMGINLDFVEGEGPKIFNPIKSAADIEKLAVPKASENVAYTLEAIRLVSRSLAPKHIPVIGFSGAPITLSAYLVEDRVASGLSKLKRLMYQSPESFHLLQQKLSDLISEYLVAQVEAGASAVQLFDSWLGAIGPVDYAEFVEPYLKKIIGYVKERTKVPFVYFAPGTAPLLGQFAKLGFDVFGVDWRISLKEVNKEFAGKYPLQGNLDPALLLGPWERLERAARKILDEGRGLNGYVFNLGHGILPETPIENVERLVKLVRDGTQH